MKRNRLTAQLLRSSILSGVVSAMFVPGITVHAQDETVVEDRIVVTGSRIRRPVDTTLAVTGINAEEYEIRGFTNVLEALDEIPLVGVNVDNRGPNTQRGDNFAFPNILNLGSNRTLTLVNGRRFVSSNQATVFVPGNQNGVQVDLSVINPALVERTEVVVVGGGPVYGADAVAGVVNVILKDNFEGLDLVAQGGITQRGDGESARVAGAWGKNLWDGRANLTLAGEYQWSDLIWTGSGKNRVANRAMTLVPNPLNASNSDGLPSQVWAFNTFNPLIPEGGLLTGAPFLTGAVNTSLFPNFAAQSRSATLFNDFVAATGMSPWAYAQTPAGQAIDPMLYVGTFGAPGSYITVANPDAATNGFLPTLAIPLTFAPNGNIVPYNIGNILPPNPALQNTVIGGDGFRNGEFTNLQSEQERYTGNMMFRYDLTNNIRFKTALFFADVKNTSIGAPQANPANGSTTAGNRPVPIYINDNPYLNAQALGVISDLQAQGVTLPTIDGEPVLYLSRVLADITGPINTGERQRLWHTMSSLEGEFNFLNREFDWSIAFGYGVSTVNSFGVDVRDIEFALATDVVDVGNGPQCRMQVTGIEPISVRNPQLAFINHGFPAPVTPTQAQVDACVPLNLLGAGNPSQAAIDYVLTSNDSFNKSQQYYGAASLGGTIMQLPAGPLQFNSQFEWRRELNRFIPGESFIQGLGRTTKGDPSDGYLRFFEGGTEFIVPVFGGDVRPFFFDMLELNGAVRVVARGAGSPINPQALTTPGKIDTTFTGGGRWSPFEGITFRGNRTRSIRSASVVELVGAGITGFTAAGMGNLHPCGQTLINGGPPGGIRRQNCEAAAAALGLAPGFLDTFNAVPAPPNMPAAASGNPFLENEKADSWTVGVVLQPKFAPGLTITSDYYSVDISGQLALTAFVNDCFDQPTFPNSTVAGLPVCELVIFGVPDGMGGFVVPNVNPLTGTPVLPVANPGSPANAQAPFNFTFIQFAQVNQSAVELRSLNTTISYNFELADVLGSMADGWGDVRLRGTAYYLRRFDLSASGTFADVNPAAGEHTDPRFQTRMDVMHRVGPFSHTLSWFRDSSTVTNILVNPTLWPEQQEGFELPSYNRFNYGIGWDINDNFTARFIVNNLTDARQAPRLGVSNDTIGRRFVASIHARF